MKILYLCDKVQYDTKMSRVRFQSMQAISNISELVWSGVGWDNYNNDRTVQENINNLYGNESPDIIVAYKPLNLIDFYKAKPLKCIRYNEMWDIKSTTNEIIKSGAELIICHHLNDMYNYKHIPSVKFVNISHCAEQTIYRDYGLPKTTDILLTGAISSHYPFRARLRNIMVKYLFNKVKCKVLSHPGGDLTKVHGVILEDYAKELNRAKITLTCSSKYKYRLGKYVEIPMSGSLLAADLPCEDNDFFRQFMLVLDPSWSDDKIAENILKYVYDDNGRELLIQKGLELNKNYTQEKYAERFTNVVENFLKGKK